MADVNVNIRGRDEGLGDALDSLRQKAQELGRDVEKLNQLSDMTPTQQKIAIDKQGQDTLRAQQAQIKSEHAALRQQNIKDYQEAEKSYKAGDMSKADFDKQTQYFKEAQSESMSTEEEELKRVQKEMTIQLRLIHREMLDQRKLNREKAQRDRKEFGVGGSGATGVMGSLALENQQLKKEKLSAKSADEVRELEERIQANKQRMREMEGKDDGRDGGGGDGGRRFDSRDATSLANAFANANLLGASTQTAQHTGNILGMSKAGATTAGIIAAAWGLMSQSSQMYEAGGRLGALRGRGYGGRESMQIGLGEATEGLGGIGYDYGMTPVDILQLAEGKARRTGMVGNDIMGRTMRDMQLERGMGVDVSGFDQFERFTTALDESNEIALDVLNVLNGIQDSSLKEGDLATFGEKIATMQTLMQIQRSKRDLVDTDESLRMLSAWEAIGLSQKGEKAGDFMQQTITGLGEGGSDNLMLLKYEAAKQAHPELANDPAALRRFVRFNSDDPAYMAQFFQYAGRITGDNKMAMDDLLYSFFNPQSEYDMELYQRAMESGDFTNIMQGQGKMKGKRSGTMTQAYAAEEAKGMVGGLDQLVAGFKEGIGDLAMSFENWLSSVTGGGSTIDVSIAKNKLGNMPVSKETKGVKPKKGG